MNCHGLSYYKLPRAFLLQIATGFPLINCHGFSSYKLPPAFLLQIAAGFSPWSPPNNCPALAELLRKNDHPSGFSQMVPKLTTIQNTPPLPYALTPPLPHSSTSPLRQLSNHTLPNPGTAIFMKQGDFYKIYDFYEIYDFYTSDPPVADPQNCVGASKMSLSGGLRAAKPTKPRR